MRGATEERDAVLRASWDVQTPRRRCWKQTRMEASEKPTAMALKKMMAMMMRWDAGGDEEWYVHKYVTVR